MLVVRRGAGGCVRASRLAPMTDYDILTHLRADWRFLGHQPASRDSLEQVRRLVPDAPWRDVTDLGDVLRALDTSGGRPQLERHALITALLRGADDPLVARALLQALLPGIVSVCRRLRFGAGALESPSETVGVAASLATELIAEWAGQSRPYAAPDLLSALRGRLRRYIQRERHSRDAALPLAHHDVARDDVDLASRLAALGGGPHARLARLTYARVLEGRSWREVAAADHSHPATLRAEVRSFVQSHVL